MKRLRPSGFVYFFYFGLRVWQHGVNSLSNVDKSSDKLVLEAELSALKVWLWYYQVVFHLSEPRLWITTGLAR